MTEVAVGVIGPGLVGSAVLQQLAAQRDVIRTRRGATFNVLAVASSKRMLLTQTHIVEADWAAVLNSDRGAPLDLAAFANFLLAAAGPRRAVIVDCSASESLPLEYAGWIARGIHIVTPNKKGFSSDLALYQSLTTRGPALCLFEATVGAGLPVLATLTDMMDSGDRVEEVEGILSGTLSFIFNTFSTPAGPSALRFSDIVKDARARGFTEPDPRDDLNGMDFARKVVILARIAGFASDLSTTQVQNLVPPALQSVTGTDAFLARLDEMDAEFDRLNREAFAAGQVLRYVGRIDGNGAGSVGLQRYAFAHPFAGLSGSDNIVSLRTERYSNPLIIRGAGAGAQVTAMGVLGNMLRIADACSMM